MRREDFSHEQFLEALRRVLADNPLPPPRIIYAKPDHRYAAQAAKVLQFRSRTMTWSDPDAH
jgi:hypothetical protein